MVQFCYQKAVMQLWDRCTFMHTALLAYCEKYNCLLIILKSFLQFWYILFSAIDWWDNVTKSICFFYLFFHLPCVHWPARISTRTTQFTKTIWPLNIQLVQIEYVQYLYHIGLYNIYMYCLVYWMINWTCLLFPFLNLDLHDFFY